MNISSDLWFKAKSAAGGFHGELHVRDSDFEYLLDGFEDQLATFPVGMTLVY